MVKAVRAAEGALVGGAGTGSANAGSRTGIGALVDQQELSAGELWRYSRVAVGEYLIPVAMAVGFLFTLFTVVERTGDLLSWDERHAGSGSFLVESCRAETQIGPDQWVCEGIFAPVDHSEVRGTLTTSQGAFTSDRPYVGQRLDVFHLTDNASVVHPESTRLNELAGAYLAVLPWLLVLVGTAIWLAGWLSTRNVRADDFVTRDAIVLPQRFGWQGKGVIWLVVAVAMIGINFFVVTRLIGSATPS